MAIFNKIEQPKLNKLKIWMIQLNENKVRKLK